MLTQPNVLTNVEAMFRLISLRVLSVISQFFRPKLPPPPPPPRGAMNPKPVHLAESTQNLSHSPTSRASNEPTTTWYSKRESLEYELEHPAIGEE